MQIISDNKLYLRLFTISYGLFLTYSLLGHISAFSAPLKWLTYPAMGLLILNFILQRRKCTRYELLLYAVFMGFSLISAAHNNNFGFFKLVLFAGSIKLISLKDVIKFDMYLRSALIVLVIILCHYGIAPDVTIGFNEVERHSMGFTNPNTLGIAVFILMCDILYTQNLKINIRIMLLTSFLVVWLYQVARCRTSVYAILLLIVIAMVYNISPKFFYTKLWKRICIVTPILLAAVSFVTMILFIKEDATALRINELLSGRVNSFARFAKVLTPSFFGQEISETIDHSLDNTYGFIFYDLGISVFCLFIIMSIKRALMNIKCGNAMLTIIWFVFLIYGLSEHLWINIDYNIFVIILCYNPETERLIQEHKKSYNRSGLVGD